MQMRGVFHPIGRCISCNSEAYVMQIGGVCNFSERTYFVRSLETLLITYFCIRIWVARTPLSFWRIWKLEKQVECNIFQALPWVSSALCFFVPAARHQPRTLPRCPPLPSCNDSESCQVLLRMQLRPDHFAASRSLFMSCMVFFSLCLSARSHPRRLRELYDGPALTPVEANAGVPVSCIA